MTNWWIGSVPAMEPSNRHQYSFPLIVIRVGSEIGSRRGRRGGIHFRHHSDDVKDSSGKAQHQHDEQAPGAGSQAKVNEVADQRTHTDRGTELGTDAHAARQTAPFRGSIFRGSIVLDFPLPLGRGNTRCEIASHPLGAVWLTLVIGRYCHPLIPLVD